MEDEQQNVPEQPVGGGQGLSAEELGQLAVEYPEAAGNGGVNIPKEVLELKNGGMGLLEAYRLFDLRKTRAECRKLKEQLDTEETEKQNNEASTGSVAGGDALQKDYYSPTEWDRLSDAVKKKFIRSGKVYDFMKKWGAAK